MGFSFLVGSYMLSDKLDGVCLVRLKLTFPQFFDILVFIIPLLLHISLKLLADFEILRLSS